MILLQNKIFKNKNQRGILLKKSIFINISSSYLWIFGVIRIIYDENLFVFDNTKWISTFFSDLFQKSVIWHGQDVNLLLKLQFLP